MTVLRELTFIVVVIVLAVLCAFGTEAHWPNVGWLWAFFVVIVLLGPPTQSKNRNGS